MVALPGSTRKTRQWAARGQEASLRGIPREAARAYRSQPSPLTLIRAARNRSFINPVEALAPQNSKGWGEGRGTPEPMGHATRSVFLKSALSLGTSPSSLQTRPPPASVRWHTRPLCAAGGTEMRFLTQPRAAL